MSLAGLKKQLNKANQFVSEKIGGAKGTNLDDDYLEMERKVDITEKLVNDMMIHTQEYLQPNPASRAKLMTQQAWSKVRGQQKLVLYPQPEGTLGETFLRHGKELGYDSGLGQACIETGEAFKQLSEIKYALEDSVKQNFLEPLTQLQTKDLKEISHHRKKLEGRRLDFDYKARRKEKGAAVTEQDITLAQEKFEESKELAETAMHNLLANDVEQISQVKAFVEACLNYHQQSVDILQQLEKTLQQKRSDEASGKPKEKHIPKRVASVRVESTPFDSADSNGKTSGSYSMGVASDYSAPVSKPPSTAGAKKTATAKALYDFEPENDGELGFSEGDMIELLQQIDENWYEGKFKGQTGFFPINYVEVVTPFPK